jgi:prepilin-type N-terminal cleavage/methylation domain-containing protein
VNARHRRHVRGLTLLELLVAIVVIALAGVALMGTLGYIASTSGESLGETQARAIAEAYLAEALARPFVEPTAFDNQVGRANLNDVDDYNGINDSNAQDQLGNTFGGVGQFQVNVTVVNSGGLGGLPAADVKRVDVTVRSNGAIRATATGYRTKY